MNPNVDAWQADGTTGYITRDRPPHPLVEDITSLLPDKPQLAEWAASIHPKRPKLDPERVNINGDEEWREKVRESLDWHFREDENRGRSSTYITGPILSSNHLMKDPVRLGVILKTNRDILAVEMELAGVSEAAYGTPHYPVMAISGISDIVGLQRDRRWTTYACQAAAAFTYAFIMTTPIEPRSGKEPPLSSSTDRLPSGGAGGITHQDWGNAPMVGDFFGRTKELNQLKQWIIAEQCQLIAIVGMGGIGKTSLSVTLRKGGIGKTELSAELARDIQDQFEYLSWKGLHSAPKVTEILEELIKVLSNQQEINVPATLDEQISQVLSYLRQHRCLLILDNVEAVLQGSRYREGCEGYGLFFRQIAEISHQSCLLLNSREIPPEVAEHKSKAGPVRSLELGGLGYVDGKKIFARIGSFSGSEEEWKKLNDSYRGNPLVLRLAARHLEKVYLGDISAFLKKGKLFFNDLFKLLDWHFSRLSD